VSPAPQLLATLVLLVPLAGALLVWVPEIWLTRTGIVSARAQKLADRAQDYLTTGTALASLGLVLALAGTSAGPLRFRLLFLELYLDSLSIYFLLLVSFVALAASWYAGPCWTSRAGTRAVRRTLFYSLFNLFQFTMVLVPMVSNLVVLWIGIEMTTVTSTVLVAAERTREHFEAAWKYIVITSTGIIFALLGTLFLAGAINLQTHPRPSMSWVAVNQMAADLDPNLVRLSFLFVVIGYGTKAGFAPMHTWLPDAHGEAPYPVSALLSGVLLKSALYVILRFFIVTNAALDDGGRFTSQMLLGTGLLSLVAATPFILKRNPFKRVLAYHSLEHMGIITVGIGIGGPFALLGALLHVLNHGVTKSLMFLAYGSVQDNYAARQQTVAVPAQRASPPAAAPVAARARAAADTPAAAGLPAASDPPVPPARSASATATATAEDRFLAPTDRTPRGEPTGVLRAMPWTGSILALGGLALVGSPPFSIFLSEFLILWGAIGKVLAGPSAGLVAAIVIFLGSVTLIFGGLVRHLSRLLLGSPPERVARETARQVVPLLVLLAVVVAFGLLVPDAGPLHLRRLLSDSVALVCGGGCR
jgi:formate hydrogenlyase subunit 3/multisubunit Na+/H+ antiporter MnhD subunit